MIQKARPTLTPIASPACSLVNAADAAPAWWIHQLETLWGGPMQAQGPREGQVSVYPFLPTRRSLDSAAAMSIRSSRISKRNRPKKLMYTLDSHTSEKPAIR